MELIHNLVSHAKAEKKNKIVLILQNLVSGLLCGFWDAVELEIMLKSGNSG